MAGARRFLRENGLSLVLAALFMIFVSGQAVSGWLHYNEENREHGRPPVLFTAYLRTGAFGEALFENWESEFLAIFAIVVLSIWLRQKGSPESKPVAAGHGETGK